MFSVTKFNFQMNQKKLTRTVFDLRVEPHQCAPPIQLSSPNFCTLPMLSIFLLGRGSQSKANQLKTAM